MTFKNTLLTFFFFVVISVFSLQSAAKAEADFTCVVAKDNHLTAIRDLFCDPAITPSQLAQYNHLSNANLLHPGQLIAIPAQWLKSKQLPIQLIVFSGDVKIKKNPSTKSEALTMQHQLEEGDELTTSQNSLVKVRFADDSVVNLQPNAKLKVVSSRQRANSDKMEILVEITQGRVEVLANPEHKPNRNFKVKSPSAVAVVRGTKFRVGADSGVMIEETLDGAVDLVVNQDKVNVTKGYGSLAEKGKPPQPPKLLPPAPEVATLAPQFDKGPVAFALPSQQGVSVTVAQVSQLEDFSQLVATQRVAMQADKVTELPLNDLADGDYYLKLRAEDAQGLQSEDVVHQFTVDLYPPTPDPVIPDVTSSPSIGWPLQWTRLEGYDGYILQVSNSDTFDAPVLDKKLFYNSFYLTHGLAPQAKYWRVGIKTDEGNQKFSSPIKLSQD